GQVSSDEVGKILDYAAKVGIDTLDTASLYGNSEEVLGKFNLERFKVVTKTVKVDKTLGRDENLNNFRDAFYKSQKNLGYIKLHGLMFHESTDLLGQNGYELWDLVNDFKEKEYVDKIGVSVYSPETLIEIIDKFDIDIVQLPLNILDQRFVYLMKELKEKGIEIHTRSTFLQGLLLMKDYEINSYFDEIKPLLKEIPEPKLAQALHFVDKIKEVDKIIVGTTCLNDLTGIVNAIESDIETIDYTKYKVTDERFILPQNWRLV
ncbi:MAG: aldo/keto reductase, partial [Cyanobacteria bacterium RUI128]|nr:aldo/keto reductase [Cyanobacteria bacterium RUI128]